MKKMISSIVLLALVSSMIFTSIPVSVYADSQSDSLIKLTTQTRDQVKIQLSKVDATQEIKEKFEAGSEQIELLIEAVQNEDKETARKHFLSAMTIFKEIIHEISERPSTSAALSDSSTTVDTSRIAHELDRLERYVAQLKRIAINNGFDLDSSNSDDLIDQARNDLRDGNSDSAISTITAIKQSITELNQILREKTRQYTTDRAISLATKHLEDLDRLIAEAKDIGVSEDTLAKLVDTREQLNSVSDASDVAKIIDEVKKLLSVKKQFEETKIQRIQVRADQLESVYDRLSNQIEDTPELDKARNMLSDLKVLLSEKKSNEAIRMLSSLGNLLKEIENSINIEEEEIQESIEEKTSTLADSKTERIKIKIDRLETSLNNLNDRVSENAAAKRWLNNAFSLLEDAKNHVDDSPDSALDVVMKIEQIIKRIQNTIR